MSDYHCMNCGSTKVIWESDFDFEDVGIAGEGIVSYYHCADCGADITYAKPFEKEDKEDE